MNNKNNTLIILVLLTFSTLSFGQSKTYPIPNIVNPFKNKTNHDTISIVTPNGKGSLAYLSNQVVKIKTTKGSFYSNLKKRKGDSKSTGTNLNSWFNLNENHSFQKKSERTDDLGLTHINYQQQYKGIPIDGCVVMMHLKNGETTSVNGQVAEFSAIDIQSSITPEIAEEISKEYLKVTHLLNTYPKELLIARIPTADSINYILAYKVRIDASQPFLMRNVYVNARTGNIIKVVNLIASADITGTANTYYSENQSITFDSYLTTYRLRESGRKIETYNAANATFTMGTGFAGYSDYINSTTTWTGVPQLSSFSISSVAQNWWYAIFADELPDLYIKVKDGSNQTVYTSGYLNNINAPATFSNLNILLINPPYKVEIWDYDAASSDDFGGSYTITTIVGTQSLLGNGNSGSCVISNTSNPALDVHWGMEKTYDFYLNVFGRNSFDGNGSLIKNFINPDPSIFNTAGFPNNAFALSAPYNIMVYGMGDGIEMNPVVGLDVEGHEYSHMVIDNNGNGGLDYQGESGALNESFADIFGTCVEFSTLGESANWTIGENVMVSAPYLRSMNNPNSRLQPDTYNGQYWKNTLNLDDDEGGVHTNSGVQNFWFYLLCQGGSGINDLGNAYSVAGIGITQARQIVYKNLTTYLPPNSTYLDAFNGTLQAAQDLYGNPSVPYSAVRSAWYAVGIGNDPNNYCSGTTQFTAPSGTITDGSGTSNYGNNAKCSWVIAPAGATEITLNFTNFDTETGYDSVIVYNGPDNTYPKLMTWWGNTLPPTINSTGGAICIRFSSDDDNTASGWSVNYTTTGLTPTCSGMTILSTPTGAFDEGSGIGNYVNNQLCYWYIAPPCASTVTLSFSSFNTENEYDGIVVYDGLEGTNQLAVLTGNSLPTPVTSNTGQLFIVFVSDYSRTEQGFTANYVSTGSASCTGTSLINTSDYGTITDGSGSNNYCNNLNCQWLIQPPQATSVTLNFTAFDLEVPSSDGKSVYDAVEIYDGTTTGSPLIGRFSGGNIPPVVTSSGGNMLVRFYSDLDFAKQGWSAYYTSSSTSYCTGIPNLTTSIGTFSDGSGTNQYSNNSQCSWLIQPTNASSITLSFSEFNTELNYDGVIVYDGVNNSSPVLGQFTGTNLPNAVTSTGGNMFLEFLTDPAVRGNGWTANYTSTITTGIEETLLKKNLKIFPNPTNGIFVIESCIENTTLTAQILDLSGKQVLKTYTLNVGTNQIDASSLSKGIYLIKLSFEGGYHLERLVIN